MEKEKALVEEKTFGDYHMYTIRHRIDLNQSEMKQIESIPSTKMIPRRKYYRASISTGCNEEPDILTFNAISFNNTKENQVAMPLPKDDAKIFN